MAGNRHAPTAATPKMTAAAPSESGSADPISNSRPSERAARPAPRERPPSATPTRISRPPFAQDRSENVALLRADRFPHRDLLDPRADRQREDAVDPDQRKPRRDDRKTETAGASRRYAVASDSRRIFSIVVACSTAAVGSTACTSRRTSAVSAAGSATRCAAPDASRTRRSARKEDRSPVPPAGSALRSACRRRRRRSRT